MKEDESRDIQIVVHKQPQETREIQVICYLEQPTERREIEVVFDHEAPETREIQVVSYSPSEDAASQASGLDGITP